MQISFFGQSETNLPQDTAFNRIIASLPKNPTYLGEENWAALLTEEITERISQNEPQFPLTLETFVSRDNRVLCVKYPESKAILLIFRLKNGIAVETADIDNQSAIAIRKIWETSPKAKIRKPDGDLLIPITYHNFVDLIVVEPNPDSQLSSSVTLFHTVTPPNERVFLFNKAHFIQQADQMRKLSDQLSLPEDFNPIYESGTVMAIRYATLLYSFSYSVTIDSLKNGNTSFHPDTEKIFALFKILSLTCSSLKSGRSDSVLFGVPPDQALTSALEAIRLDAMNEKEGTAHAYVFWTLLQKKMVKFSLLTKKLEYDTEAILKKIPELLERMENLLYKDSAFDVSSNFSHQETVALLSSLDS